ncbi:MAG TPA: hypothetical protein VLY21_02110 [Nitrososphaerales archaeon]|nr:hypothetical protein [Nitrososphaerales archaeon]
MVRGIKRYVLIGVTGEWDGERLAKLGRLLEQRHGRIKLIPVDGRRDRLIVKTTPAVAGEIRDSLGDIEIQGSKVVSLRTSGCIGNLKKLARDGAASALAKVHERRVLQEPRDGAGERPEVE